MKKKLQSSRIGTFDPIERISRKSAIVLLFYINFWKPWLHWRKLQFHWNEYFVYCSTKYYKRNSYAGAYARDQSTFSQAFQFCAICVDLCSIGETLARKNSWIYVTFRALLSFEVCLRSNYLIPRSLSMSSMHILCVCVCGTLEKQWTCTFVL